MLGQFGVVVNFFFTLIKLATELPLWRLRPVPPELPTIQPEPSAMHDITEDPPVPIDQMMKMALLVIGACFATAGVALQALQTPAPRPPTFPLFCMSLLLAFLALFVSIYIRRRYKKASLVMEHVAVFFGATASVLAITMNLKTPFMEISIALSFIAILIIIFANR